MEKLPLYRRIPWWLTVIFTLLLVFVPGRIVMKLGFDAHEVAALQSRTSIVRSAIMAYVEDHGRYPMTLEELDEGFGDKKYWGDATVLYTPPDPKAPEGTPILVVIPKGRFIKVTKDDFRVVLEGD